MKFFAQENILQLIEAYLQRKGWKIVPGWKLPATRWQLPGEDFAQVILPNNKEVEDYKSAMSAVFDELVRVEKRNIQDIYSDIIKKEHITIRVVGKDVEDGEIPIKDGAQLFSGAFELIEALANFVFDKRPDLKRKDKEAYLNSVMLGQTEIGSYAINLYSPQIPVKKQGQESFFSQDFNISDSLIDTLKKLRQSLEEFAKDEDAKVFSSLENAKLSEKMCEAILSMSNEEREVEIKTSGNWEGKKASITFKQQHVSRIDQALSYFKDKDYTLRNTEISGKIISLEREEDSEMGKVKISAKIKDKTKNVAIKLSPEEYNKAIKYHEKKLTVSCRGDLSVKPRSAFLDNPKNFRVLQQNLEYLE